MNLNVEVQQINIDWGIKNVSYGRTDSYRLGHTQNLRPGRRFYNTNTECKHAKEL
jgi:hypothetical protein